MGGRGRWGGVPLEREGERNAALGLGLSPRENAIQYPEMLIDGDLHSKGEAISAAPAAQLSVPSRTHPPPPSCLCPFAFSSPLSLLMPLVQAPSGSTSDSKRRAPPP